MTQVAQPGALPRRSIAGAEGYALEERISANVAKLLEIT